MNLKTVLLLGACVPFGPALALVGDGSPTDNTCLLYTSDAADEL